MTTPPVSPTLSIAAWTRYLQSRGGPVLTWYAVNRLELGGPVMASWLAKTDNFLDAEFPFGGQTFTVALPPTWRALPWMGAAWLRGWELVSADAEPDLLVSDDPALLEDAVAGGLVAVAQALGPLAMSWPGSLPAGALDAIADVLSQADHLVAPVEAPRASPLGAGLTLGQLQETSLLDAPAPLEGARVQVTATDPVRQAAQIMQLWWAGASAVVIDEGHWGPEKSADIRRQEKVTWVLGN